MKALIDALRDEGPSLADFEEYRLLAAGMSRLGAYSMLLSDNTFGLEAMVESYLERPKAAGEDAAKVRATFAGPGTLRPYQAFATGAGRDEDGPYMALALVHADSGPAEENVELLRRRIEEGSSSRTQKPWSDRIDVANLEVRSEGRLLLAKLRGSMERPPTPALRALLGVRLLLLLAVAFQVFDAPAELLHLQVAFCVAVGGLPGGDGVCGCRLAYAGGDGGVSLLRLTDHHREGGHPRGRSRRA